LDDVAASAGAALSVDGRRFPLWSRWFDPSVTKLRLWAPMWGPERDEAILRAFVVLGILALLTDGTPPVQHTWIASHRHQIKAVSDSLAGQPSLWAGLGLEGAHGDLALKLSKLLDRH